MGSTSYSRLGFTPDPSGLTIRDHTRRSLAVSRSAGQPGSLRARSHRARVAQNCIVVGSMNEEAAPADVRSQNELPRCCRLQTRNPRYPGMGRKKYLTYQECIKDPSLDSFDYQVPRSRENPINC